MSERRSGRQRRMVDRELPFGMVRDPANPARVASAFEVSQRRLVDECMEPDDEEDPYRMKAPARDDVLVGVMELRRDMCVHMKDARRFPHGAPVRPKRYCDDCLTDIILQAVRGEFP